MCLYACEHGRACSGLRSGERPGPRARTAPEAPPAAGNSLPPPRSRSPTSHRSPQVRPGPRMLQPLAAALARALAGPRGPERPSAPRPGPAARPSRSSRLEGPRRGRARPAAVASVAAAAAPPAQRHHVVAKGDTIFSVAKAHGLTVRELQALNHLQTDRLLLVRRPRAPFPFSDADVRTDRAPSSGSAARRDTTSGCGSSGTGGAGRSGGWRSAGRRSITSARRGSGPSPPRRRRRRGDGVPSGTPSSGSRASASSRRSRRVTSRARE